MRWASIDGAAEEFEGEGADREETVDNGMMPVYRWMERGVATEEEREEGELGPTGARIPFFQHPNVDFEPLDPQ